MRLFALVSNVVLIALATLATALPAGAQTDRAGVFDYYVLSLSWQPNWCADEGRARGAPECGTGAGGHPGVGRGWVLHGLWPQRARGWPEFCRTPERPPSRAMTAGMADIMGSPGLAWHQWRKHGSCSGLPAAAYFALSRRAFDKVQMPPELDALDRPVRLPAQLIEAAFLQANPAWHPDMLTITCKNGRIQEARLCLSRDLDPVRCGADVIRDCGLRDALFLPRHP